MSIRNCLFWLAGLAFILAGAWIIGGFVGGAGYQSAPTVFAGYQPVYRLCVLVLGIGLLGAGSFLFNKPGHQTYLGPSVVALALCVALLQKPGLDAWLRSLLVLDERVFYKLAFESVVWQAGVLGILVLGAGAPKPWEKARTGALLPSGQVDVTEVLFNRWTRRTWSSAGVGLAAFFVCSWCLVRAPGPAQALWGSAMAAFIGAVLARVNFPSRNPLPLFAIPLFLGPAVYLYAAYSYSNELGLLVALNARKLPGLANALPCHLAAGSLLGFLAGCLLVNKANEQDQEPEPS